MRSLRDEHEEPRYHGRSRPEEHPGLERPVAHRRARALRERAQVESKTDCKQDDGENEHGYGPSPGYGHWVAGARRVASWKVIFAYRRRRSGRPTAVSRHV